MGIKKGRVKFKYFLPLLTIIPFLGFFFYFVIFTSSPIFLLRSLFFEYTPNVKYESFKVYIDDSVPSLLSEKIRDSVDDIVFNDIKRFNFVEEKKAEYILGTTSESESLFTKELFPVGHFYWVKESFDSDDDVIMEQEEYVFASEYFEKELGIQVRKVESLLDELKKSEDTVGFLFASKLSSQFKVLNMDEKYPLESGGITVSYGLGGGENLEFVSNILEKNVQDLRTEDVLEEELVKINMTGVTAISRGLASLIERSGNDGYAARDIGDFLADADLTHTSNEVSFVEGCNVVSGMRFCSKPEYIEILKESGIDIVELTGNHNNDFGASNNAKSIEMYKDLGWDYFGGGLDSEDASKILYKEVKGSKIAFVGYNYYDTMLNTLALAGESRAGANSYSEEKLESDIKEARENADVVIVTFQFQECWSYPPSDVIYPVCYKPLSSPDQKGVFRKAADFGADIVVGTQAHQPQTFEYYNDSLIFYGLGNIYFDQSRWIGTRQGIVLSLYILEDKVVQVKMTPTIYDRDLIPRVASFEEGQLLLNLLKSARTF